MARFLTCKILFTFIAECLSTRHLILQYNLTMRCMSVTLWNAIITVGISVTSLVIASATLYMYHVHELSSHAHMVYMYLVWNVERSWPGFENKGKRERDGWETWRKQARMHQQTSRARETSQWRSVNLIIDALHWVAAFCHPTVYRSAKTWPVTLV